MASRKEHIDWGAPLGAIAAFAFAVLDGQSLQNALIEAAGGGGGGYVGATAPDFLEPATSPNHRQLAHSRLAGFSLAGVTVANVRGWQRRLRAEADRLNALAAATPDRSASLNLRAQAVSLRMLVGVLPGLAAGYLSHLVLDSTTPRGLP